MPTLEEAESLYDEDHVIRDMDRMDIFISDAFSPGGGFTSWTSNELPHATAAIFYYRYGHGNANHKEDITKDSVRAVRDIEKRVNWMPIQDFVYREDLSKEYTIDANWALYCDNYLEGFHIPFIHEDLNNILDYKNYRKIFNNE